MFILPQLFMRKSPELLSGLNQSKGIESEKTLAEQFENLYALIPDTLTNKIEGRLTKAAVHSELDRRVKGKDMTSKNAFQDIGADTKELFETLTPKEQQEYIDYLLKLLLFARNPFKK